MKRATVLIAGVALVVLAVAWMRLRSTEGGPAGEASVAASPASQPAPAATRAPGRALAGRSSEDEPWAIPSAAAVDRSPAKGCALGRGEDPACPFLAPDEETTQELARCGIARFDLPLLLPSGSGLRFFPDEWLAKAGVDAAEHQRLEQAAAAFMAEHRQRWTELAASVGIEREWSDASTPSVVFLRIAAEFDDDQVATAVERVAHERAGWEPSRDALPAPLEAAVRLRADTGEAFETAIAGVVGEARAAELRAVADGWPGGHGWMGNRCESEPPLPVPERFVPSTAKDAESCVDDMKGRGCAFHDPSRLELDRMADCGVVRIELPGFVGDRSSEPTFDFAARWADDVDLTPQEAAVLAEVGDHVREALFRDFTQLALEAGKTQAWADETSFVGMLVAVGEASATTPAQSEQMLRRLAAERAGRAAPPTDLSGLSLEERFTRRILELGDELEQALAERLGPDRADALRRAHDGWPGLRNQTQNFCNGNDAQFL
ncbi:MAG: hypothetical protein KDK70_12480 [Myxococcales bacterium]|nr:hypothetical protein [Myxococcales bacterium]